MEWAEEKGRTVGTLKTAMGRFKNHILPEYEGLNMLEVPDEAHQVFFNYLRHKGVPPATRNRIRSLLQVVYNVAIRNKLFGGAFKGNPIANTSPAEEPKKVVSYWSKGDVEKLLWANRASHYHPLLLFLLRTGVRIGEAIGSQGEQVNEANQLFTIDRQFDSAANRVVFSTKGKSCRTIFLVDEVMDVLKPLGHGPLFRKKNGTLLFPNYFRQYILPKLCEKAKVNNIGPHGTRHTFAAHYLMDGGSLWDLSKILGHSDTKVTETRYGHFDVEHIRNRMDVIDKKLKLAS